MREEKPRSFASLAEAMAALQERTERENGGLKIEASDPGRRTDEVRERIERRRICGHLLWMLDPAITWRRTFPECEPGTGALAGPQESSLAA